MKGAFGEPLGMNPSGIYHFSLDFWNSLEILLTSQVDESDIGSDGIRLGSHPESNRIRQNSAGSYRISSESGLRNSDRILPVGYNWILSETKRNPTKNPTQRVRQEFVTRIPIGFLSDFGSYRIQSDPLSDLFTWVVEHENNRLFEQIMNEYVDFHKDIINQDQLQQLFD